MEETKVVMLDSGAKLEIMLALFDDGKALCNAVMEEVKEIKIDAGQFGVETMLKDLFCVVCSSKKVEAALKRCMSRVTYNGLKVTDDTWQPRKAREDYYPVSMEVFMENLEPFSKSLYAKFRDILERVKALQNVPA